MKQIRVSLSFGLAISVILPASSILAVPSQSGRFQDDAAQTAVIAADDEDNPDLPYIAESLGFTLDEARAQVIATEVIGALAERIAAEKPEIFVLSAVSLEPYGKPSIYIKGTAGPYVEGLVADAPIEIEIVDNQPLSAEELRERQAAVRAALTEAGFGEFAIKTDYRSGGVITVAYEAGKGIDEDAVQRALPEGMAESVIIDFRQGPLGTLDNSFGGMRGAIDGSDWCMFAFSVYNLTTGTTGVTSAEHCGAAQNGIKHPGHGVHDATRWADHYGQYGDFGWWTTPEDEPPKFYADVGGLKRDVTSVEPLSNLSEDETVCFYSRVQQDRFCAQVDAWGVGCPPGDRDGMVEMNADQGTGGDSGGGWSFNYRAFGVHSGACYVGDVFSPAYYHDNALNVAVRIVGGP